MSAKDLDRVIADASPMSDARARALDLKEAEAALMEEIASTSHLAEDAAILDGQEARHHKRRRWFGWRGPAVALVCLGLAGALVLGGLDSDGDDGSLAFGEEVIRIAEANPRLLVTYPGWRVTRADLQPDFGEMTFSDGEYQLDLFYYPADRYEGFYEGRSKEYPPPEEIEIIDTRASVFETRSDGLAYFDTVTQPLPPDRDAFVEIRGDSHGDLEEGLYLDVIRSLEATDVTTWLSAMPASAVKPADTDQVVDEMLKGIPIPPDFEVDALKSDPEVRGLLRNRYQLAAIVTGAVTCEWLERWNDARFGGNDAEAREARAALDTAPNWPILHQMEREGKLRESILGAAEDGLVSTSSGPDTVPHYWNNIRCLGPNPENPPQLERAYQEFSRAVSVLIEHPARAPRPDLLPAFQRAYDVVKENFR